MQDKQSCAVFKHTGKITTFCRGQREAVEEGGGYLVLARM